MTEFKIEKIWAIATYIGSVILFAFLLLFSSNIAPSDYLLFAPFYIVLFGFIVYAILKVYKSKFLVGHNSVTMVGVFSTNDLPFDEINGYRTDGSNIYIESYIPGKKRIKISSYFQNPNTIIHWLDAKYPDLDLAEAELEKAYLLNNSKTSYEETQLNADLRKAHRISTQVNWAAGLLAVWTFIYPTPRAYEIIICILVPLIAIVFAKTSRGLIRLNYKKGTYTASVYIAIVLPTAMILMRTIATYHILDFSNVWLPVVFIALLLMVVVSLGNKNLSFKESKNYSAVLGTLVLFLGYAYGVVITLNDLPDETEPQTFQAKILSKRENTSKASTYYLELAPWGPQKDSEEVDVDADIFNKLNVNEKATISLRKGLFDIPWYSVVN